MQLSIQSELLSRTENQTINKAKGNRLEASSAPCWLQGKFHCESRKLKTKVFPLSPEVPEQGENIPEGALPAVAPGPSGSGLPVSGRLSWSHGLGLPAGMSWGAHGEVLGALGPTVPHATLSRSEQAALGAWGRGGVLLGGLAESLVRTEEYIDQGVNIVGNS